MDGKKIEEEELFQQLKKEAEEVKVPEELSPQNIQKKLAAEKKKKSVKWKKYLTAAAVLVLCITAAVNGNRVFRQNEISDSTISQTEKQNSADIGIYQKASDYDDVYEELKRTQDTLTSGIEDSAMEDGASVSDSAIAERAEGDHSSTNLQTEGIDESDIVKTDGNYIYAVCDNKVEIYNIQNIKPQKTAEIMPEIDSAVDEVKEMYVDNNELFLIIQKQESTIQESSIASAAGDCDICYMAGNCSTEILSYDISDRTAPVLSGHMEQDGSYHTSRKAGSILYLFTDYNLSLPDYAQKTAVAAKLSTWIPSVGNQLIPADSIYLPQAGTNGLIISSMNCKDISQTLDLKMIVQNGVEVYVSSTSIYLYGTAPDNGQCIQIAHFSMGGGKIEPKGSASVDGYIMDTFAINEYQGYLRILITGLNESSTNAVYVYDAQMKLVGQITGIAKGEEIYSARFLKNTGYFVTYRNTDPLFAVDFSNPENPVLLGELKITGFSEYLHFWGEDKLLGIGYETDSVTGDNKGLKLSMFDISDPSNIQEENKIVLSDADYSPALYQYKCVLADADKNIIGLAVENYEKADELQYAAFSYDNGFISLFTETLDCDVDSGSYRGLYSGNYFYLVGNDHISVYDMKDGYRKIQ